MHIPDGYLSPSTCAALYAGSAPFWYVSLRRMKRVVNTRTVPLLAVFAAFSFIIMMFNLPLPGGTTGHAVGVSIAAIVLGPWGSILAISIALMIQAVFFGDGGITSLGANCFNMAVVGSLASYAIYRIVAGRAPIESRRRVIAAAMAGYFSINLAALVTAIELGIQPLLFRDASGAPLYAPYSLHIAIPAMMLGHLTVAGLAETIVTAGAVAYLQRAEPSLLIATASDPGDIEISPRLAGDKTPVDGPGRDDDSHPTRHSGGRLGVVAMVRRGFLQSARPPTDDVRLGKSRSAAAGSCGASTPRLILDGAYAALRSSVFEKRCIRIHALGDVRDRPSHPRKPVGRVALSPAIERAAGRALRMIRSGSGTRFIERTLANLVGASEYAANAERIAAAGGILQRVDPRVKLAGLLGLVIVVASAHRLPVIAALFIIALILAFLSRISIAKLCIWIWTPVLFFTGTIAAPALFLTPGTPLFLWGRLVLSSQGLRSAAFLFCRAETAATLSALLVLTTPWPWVLKSLRIFKFPMVLVAILGMAYRYIFVILQTALDMFESRKSRTVGVMEQAERRRLAASAIGVLLSKSFDLSGDVHLAMQSRGFQGEIYVLQDFQACAADWCWLGGFAALAVAAFWWGR